MPTKRFENLAPDRRRRILDAALAEFARNGYERASLNAIIRDAGISKGSLYYYFEDKADLYVTIIWDAAEMKRNLGGIGKGIYSDDFWRDMEEYTRKSMRMILEHPDIARITREIFRLPPSFPRPKAIEEMFEQSRAQFSGILEHGRDAGAVRTDMPLDLLVSVLSGISEAVSVWLLDRFDTLSPEDVENMAGIYIDLMKRAAGKNDETI